MKNYFTLSGLYPLKQLNFNLKYLYVTHYHYFNPNCKIQNVYGNFPNAIWNGEDVNYSNSQLLINDITTILNDYTYNHLQVMLNFTNSELTREDCDDTYCNLLLQTCLNLNVFTQCVVNSKILYEHLITNYPELLKIYIGRNNEIPQDNVDFKTYFLNPIFNNDFNYLKDLKNKNEIIITLNPFCHNCDSFHKCLYKENIAQLEYDPDNSKRIRCPFYANQAHDQSDLFITNELIDKYNEYGFNHFILNEMPTFKDNIETYLYYFIQPKYWDEAREILKQGVIE